MRVLIDKNSKITNIYYGNSKKENWIEIDSIPEPEQKEGYVPVPYYREGEIVYEYEAIPNVPEEEMPEVDEIEMMRASTEERVKAMFFASAIPSVINTFGLSNKEALSVKEMFPQWDKDLGEVVKGERYNYGENLWEVVQSHTTQENWAPSLQTSSLWKVVEDGHEGTESDPIPYTPPMEIFEGKYYYQDEVKYKCTRSSGAPLSHALKDLVGLYVIKV